MFKSTLKAITAVLVIVAVIGIFFVISAPILNQVKAF